MPVVRSHWTVRMRWGCLLVGSPVVVLVVLVVLVVVFQQVIRSVVLMKAAVAVVVSCAWELPAVLR